MARNNQTWAEINKIETNNNNKNETKNWLFVKINELYKLNQ